MRVCLQHEVEQAALITDIPTLGKVYSCTSGTLGSCEAIAPKTQLNA